MLKKYLPTVPTLIMMAIMASGLPFSTHDKENHQPNKLKNASDTLAAGNSGQASDQENQNSGDRRYREYRQIQGQAPRG